MFRRAFTVFLAAVLLWSSLAAQERTLPEPGADAMAWLDASSGQDSRSDGSVDDHHIDDLPAQSALEHASDLPAWFPATRVLMPFAAGGAARLLPVAPGAMRNVADVPQRPPCA